MSELIYSRQSVIVRTDIANDFDPLRLCSKYLCGDSRVFADSWPAAGIHYGQRKLWADRGQCRPLSVVKICGHSEFLGKDCPNA
jgi:hypothetical protein